MATYTMQLRVLIEKHSQFEPNLSYNERIEIGREHLFDFDYPFFDEDERTEFERNFIRNFYMREIGFEVEELFKMRLENWLHLNMPYYNQLFESELIEFDPLINSKTFVAHGKIDREGQTDQTKSKTDFESEDNTRFGSDEDNYVHEEDTSTFNAQGRKADDDFNRLVSSDNPDGRLKLQTQEGKGVIEYAGRIDETKANDLHTYNDTGDTKRGGQTTGRKGLKATDDKVSQSERNRKDDYVSEKNKDSHFMERRLGKIGNETYSKMLRDYRLTFMRIQKEMFDEMQELFMMIY